MTQMEISRRLGVSDRTVRNYLKSDLIPVKRKKKTSKLDPHYSFIKTILEENPHYNCELIYEKLKASGYTGRISILRELAKKIRSKILTDAVIRFETTPGLQAQVDWKEFGKQQVEGKDKKLYAFTMTLGYSRLPFIRFTTSMKTNELLRCHQEAFRFFGGVSSEILYDNMKTAFVADSEGVFHVQRDLLHFAAHYGFEPKRCRVRRPQTKGKVERTIGFLMSNFWPRVEGANLSLAELNRKGMEWIDMISQREMRELGESRKQRFDREKNSLKPLPQIDLDTRRSLICAVSKESCITIETNRYSVNPGFIGDNVIVRIDDERGCAEIFHENESFRVIILEAPGSRAIKIFDEDLPSIRHRHRNDMNKKFRLMKRKRQRSSSTAVDIRHPCEYDTICVEEAVK